MYHCCSCQHICYIGIVIVFVAIALGLRELIHHATKSSEPVKAGISSASDDVLELDPRLNVMMSDASPLTIILIVGGVAFTMLASFLTHRHVIKPWQSRNTEREEEEEAHKQTTARVLNQIQSRLDTVEEGRGANRGQRAQEEGRQQNPYYPNGLSLVGLQNALQDLAFHQEQHHPQHAPRGLPAPPAPAPTPLGSHCSQQSFPQGQGSQVNAERAYRLPNTGNI